MKDELFEELQQSIKEGGKILKGEKRAEREFIFINPDPKKIRTRLGLSQIKFAQLLGISPSTLQNWEQGRRKPEGPAKVLLNIADKHPSVVLDTNYYYLSNT